MNIEDYTAYERYDFCHDLPCAIRKAMSEYQEGSDEYERIKALCNGKCLHTSKELINWFNDHGCIILKPKH